MNTDSIRINLDELVAAGTIGSNERCLFHTLSKEKPALALRLLGERAAGKTTKSERNIAAEVDALVASKITEAERADYLELAATDIRLFDRIVAKLPSLRADVMGRELWDRLVRLGSTDDDDGVDDINAEARRLGKGWTKH